MPQPLIIVGLQKSGTSLLKKILASSDLVINLYPAEGNSLWGNTPPFSPDQEPTGRLYQSHQGDNGHFLATEDFLEQDGELVKQRLKQKLQKFTHRPFWLNKNPYLSVRLGWLKKIFPHAIVLACYREPLSNVFSLLKRYRYTVHGLKPEAGWWGVKPKGWKKIIGNNELITAARQWQTVNQQLLQDKSHVDCWISYHELTHSTNEVLDRINEAVKFNLACSVPFIECMDGEWATGGSIYSANQQTDKAEHKNELIPSLTQQEIYQVLGCCQNIWKLFSGQTND